MSNLGKIQNDLVSFIIFTIQDELEIMLRKKPTGVPETKIPLKNPETYAKLWFDNQEDLVYNNLMQ